ncbi:hypothetical protein [Pseudogemmobacter faecipullorum]|uniref:XRE family transcriptional regulator n=1 Tax=Pseudogemmobacter faecipullorum TaxID=2755041 RepID=A0ABS8CQT8_9RHOB|nr:hypothetical protein [Pseudogemmobacter faecipullorum]MCB5411772.1 hypothetical protein [Pseudogemmobacter faecipullorum]
MNYWANDERTAVIEVIGPHVRVLRRGAVFDAAVAAGPLPRVADLSEILPGQQVEPQPVPAVISPYQAHMALLDAGLLADAELAVAAFGPAAVIAWDKATEWRRDSPTIAAIAEALDLTSDQVDDLFRAAALITA